MSHWIDRVQNHRVWTLMKDLGPLIDSAIKLEDVDAVALAGLERLRAVLTYCGKRLGGGDPLLVLPASLDSMAGSFESQESAIQAFITDKNTDHITVANGAADNALLTAFQLPGLLTSEEQIESVRNIISFRNAIEELAKRSYDARNKAASDIEDLNLAITAFKGQIQSSLAELGALIDARQNEIAKVSLDQQKAFAEAQESRSKTFNETVLKLQDNLSKTITDQQGQFSTAQENRSQKFVDLIAEYTKRLTDQDAEFTKERNDFVSAAENKLIDLYGHYEHEAEGILKGVQKNREDVEKLVGVIGSLGVTHGYQTTANRARISMWIWQTITVSAMCGLIAFAYYAFLPSIKGDFRWESLAARVFLTVTVGVLAAYAGTQADRFFHMEQNNRKLALELAAIDPFIALWPIEEQQKFKLAVGQRTFAQDETPAPKMDKSPATTLDLFAKEGYAQDVIKILLEAAQKAVKG
jgi:hypothetical protein